MKTEPLWCQAGEHQWERPVIRGRKPPSCPDHTPALARKAERARAAYRGDRPIAERTGAREDIEIQRLYDSDRNEPAIGLLRHRVAAVEDALKHLEVAGTYPLRQTLVDLAAACEEWAERLPRPKMIQQGRGRLAA